MPYIHVRLAGELTREQKKQIVEEMTCTMERIAGKPREYVIVNFDETREENWGWGGQLLDELE
ncbi:4-oxalocrotonate tautomerase family protein [Chitinibacter sp. GC72]|uniref:tautomerase family protein n=1 Tax=Chitinibacter sp. GC72 TaxID=1526917 RepID=UPI0012FCFF4E|nr:4-oxalocrotonate tautomerase family protein [Chitinibacter sp. GC72]